jgi:hypothetical protein
MAYGRGINAACRLEVRSTHQSFSLVGMHPGYLVYAALHYTTVGPL